MAGNVKFEDFSMAVIEAIDKAAVAMLHEMSGEVVSQTQRNLGKEKGRWHQEQKEQWQYKVDESEKKSTLGNPMERSIWTEFGTGSYAENGNGRKGYWVYVRGSDGSETTPTGGKSYTLQEAKQIMAMLRADGLDAHITNGQRPKRVFRNAYTTAKPKIIKRAAQVLQSHMK